MEHGTNANCSVKQQDAMRVRSGEGGIWGSRELGKWENKTKKDRGHRSY